MHNQPLELTDPSLNLHDFVEYATVAMHSASSNGIILWANQAELDLLGYSREEYIGRNVAEFHVDGAIINNVLTQLNAGQTLRECHSQLRQKNGSILDVIIDSSASFVNGKLIHTRCITRDVTGHKQVEKIRDRLAAIVHAADDAIISKDLNGIIQTWNAGAERIFGYTPLEAIGRPVTMLIPQDHINEEPAIIERISRGERIEHYETIRRRKDGALMDISLTVSPLFDQQGKVVGASKIARDITDRKQAEAELKRANADLEQFAYLATHDLQEPIRNIAIYADILNRRCHHLLDVQGNEYVVFIREAAIRMDTLVKGLLDYVQSGSDADQSFAEVDINVALNYAINNLAARIKETKAQITHGDLPVLKMRKGQFEHLFQNLIGNAIKYRSEDKSPQIHITAERVGDNWQFAVRDNGMGVPLEHRKRIFGLFKRLHFDLKYSGTGIGLSICQKIVERHGGQIWVESNGEDQGSTFYFTLPARGGEIQQG